MLIIFSKSPSTGNYESIIEMAVKTVKKREKVAILHIQNSCITTTMDKYCTRLAKAGIDAYVLKVDCQARGLLEKVRRNVEVIDYREWVKLLMDKHNKIVSWTA